MHIEKYAFSNKNGLVWRDENKMKTLVWAKIFCFVFFEMNTETFENPSVWPRCKIEPATTVLLQCEI